MTPLNKNGLLDQRKRSFSIGYTPSSLTESQWYINDTHWKNVIRSDMTKTRRLDQLRFLFGENKRRSV